MTIYERIKRRRKELGLSADMVAEALNVSRATVYRYESSEIEKLPTGILEPLAKVLKTTPQYIMGWEEAPLPEHFRPLETKALPLLGAIAAGRPLLAEENCESFIECSAQINADFCLRVQGDSMINARIHDGDIVFIRKQPDVNDGEIAAVLIDDEATLKRVYKFPELIQLHAENPKYKPMIYSRDNCDSIRILGKAVAFQSALA